MQEARPPILITGCARSGTSMTAGILHLCGCWGGNLSGPTRYNRRGMFENQDVRERLMKPYLTRIGCDPLGQDPLPKLSQLKPYPELRKEMLGLVRAQGLGAEQPWFYKGAKMCLMWPVWNYAFPSAKWVIVRRADEDIINSCIRTGFMHKRHTADSWQEWINVHKKRFAEMHRAGLDIREVWPEKFVRGDMKEIKSVIEDLGLKWNEHGVSQFIEPAWWSELRRKANG